MTRQTKAEREAYSRAYEERRAEADDLAARADALLSEARRIYHDLGLSTERDDCDRASRLIPGGRP